MDFLAVCINIIRIIFISLTIYYIIKHDFKKTKSTITVFVLTFVPILLDKIFSVKADLLGNVLYFIIIIMSIYLGSELRFYDKFIWWDRVLHFLCGVMFVSFGIPLAEKMGVTNKPGILFFCFTLSATLHILWEIAEYIVDCIAHTDHQRWQKHYKTKNHQPPKAIQPPGLTDTMNDIIICMIGTFAACAVWWFILK